MAAYFRRLLHEWHSFDVPLHYTVRAELVWDEAGVSEVTEQETFLLWSKQETLVFLKVSGAGTEG